MKLPQRDQTVREAMADRSPVQGQRRRLTDQQPERPIEHTNGRSRPDRTLKRRLTGRPALGDGSAGNEAGGCGTVGTGRLPSSGSEQEPQQATPAMAVPDAAPAPCGYANLDAACELPVRVDHGSVG
jgi:hypothetical protein